MFDAVRDKARITSAVRDAFHALEAAGHHPRICSPHHLKVGRLNFYPGRGTIFRDEDTNPRTERGLPAFVALLTSQRSRLARGAAVSEALAGEVIGDISFVAEDD